MNSRQLSSVNRPSRVSDQPKPADHTVKVVLGPTNTGKTHFAIERMLGHSSGIIGLPLRLLAREVYDRVVRLKGTGNVALITGEEKILPPKAAYFICTVEAMPLDHDAAFVAVDEIQLCGDFERGHIFTERLFHARGRQETMFLGAETMRPLLQTFLNGAEFITRPRFSQLQYVAASKITRLPPRSAVVAFSAHDIYVIAEMLRQQRGGAAVVMGALSPRTRNAQVALYQNGDVDYLVATDAIGMGLNLDVHHIAFAATSKFDGFHRRPLTASEVAQIAGRAGRHMQNGTFNLVGDATDEKNAFDSRLISAVEEHRFAPLQSIGWRNTMLDFSGLDALIKSLDVAPGTQGLHRFVEAPDVKALKSLSARSEISAITTSPEARYRLWDACQIPDFRKISTGDHTHLVSNVFQFIAEGPGTIPNDWMSRHMNPIDRVDGDIDSLAQRIAHIRTLTYIANRVDWLEEPLHWQNVTRALEDRLSDALHERLSQRFIDRRTSVLMRELRKKEHLMTTINKDGSISVEGHFIGHLEGFRFFADISVYSSDDKALRNAAEMALGEEIAKRAKEFGETADDDISLVINDDLKNPAVMWRGHVLATLKKGPSFLRPDFDLASTPLLQGDSLALVQNRLRQWIDSHIEKELQPIFRLKDVIDAGENLTGLAKGIAFQIYESGGSLPRRKIARQFRDVDKDGRRQLRALNLWLGATSLYFPALLKPGPARLRTQLWVLDMALENPPLLAKPGLVTTPADPKVDHQFYEMGGFRAIGNIAVRLDMLERVHLGAKSKAEKGPFPPEADLMSLVGCSGENFEKIMGYLGYELAEIEAPKPVTQPAKQPAPEETAKSDTENGTNNDTEIEVKEGAVLPPPAEIESSPTPAAVSDQTEPAESEPPESEPVKIKVFVRRKPAPRQRPAARPRPNTAKSPDASNRSKASHGKSPAPADGEPTRHAARPKHRNKHLENSQTGKPKGRPPQKPHVFDENSPFAALMELKKAMSGK